MDDRRGGRRRARAGGRRGRALRRGGPSHRGDRAGFWPLSALGVDAPVAITTPGTRVLARYRLPTGARQGRPWWYTIRLHLGFRFARRRGECSVSAATNGMTAAQVIVRTTRDAAEVSSLGWIQGRRRTRVTAPSSRLDFRNYLQIRGVLPGANTFSVTLDELRGRCFDRLAVFQDSGIGATRVRPDELRLLVPREPIVAVAGRPARVPFALRRRGGRPDGAFDVRLTLPSGFETAGGTTRHFERVGSLRARLVRRRRAPAPGRYVVSLAVPRRYNQPTASVELQVVERRSWLRRPPAVAAGGVAARRRRRVRVRDEEAAAIAARRHRRLAAAAIVVAVSMLAGCGGSGPDRGDYVQAKRSVSSRSCRRSPARASRATTTSYQKDESGPVAGYSTRFELALPPPASAAAVGAHSTAAGSGRGGGSSSSSATRC